jgi:superfamily II DNA/RNA helicase
MTIRRFSSRTHKLDQSFLLEHLRGARSYKRIAGYFTSSLFEVASEELEAIADVRIVCNVDIHPDDLKVAQSRAAKMVGRWNETGLEAEALLNRTRYQRLDGFLAQHGHDVRVAPDAVCGFLHGKAGVIELADGRKLSFIGSMNETRSGWREHYEILWEDDSPEGVAWIEEEFQYLWQAAQPLPDAIMREVRRRGHRHEVEFENIDADEDLAPAALVESPLYREGFALQPWQQSFVTECLRHYRNYRHVRLLLADEVGLGKTLSLGAAALTLCLLSDREKTRRRPVVIFVPATLCQQWQTEMIDKLGIPCARWETQKKAWVDHEGHIISPDGEPARIAQCPLRIGIVSTGLMIHDSMEKAYLRGLRYELVILDEAHKARSRQGFGSDAGEPNKLLAFMLDVAARAKHVLLGTATPIQTKAEDLWDSMSVLQQGEGRFVLGNDHTPWHKPDEVLPVLAGEEDVTSPEMAWEWLRSPLPLVESTRDQQARRLYSTLRQDLGLSDQHRQINVPFTELTMDARDDLEDVLERHIAGAGFFQRENPFVRHVVLRKRSVLEDEGLLTRVGVDIHPDINFVRDDQQYHVLFEDKAVRTSEDFREAYEEARDFGKALGKRRGGGFMKNLVEQRICSSIAAGISTARKLIEGRTVLAEDDEHAAADVSADTDEERAVLERLVARLSRLEHDPKLDVIIHYLDTEQWLEHGVIIFSQYYDTAKWVADALAERYPDRAVGLYAGTGGSRLYSEGQSVFSKREVLKEKVAEHEIPIMVATDAACEGLNLQTLGTLINIDLPWNPTKLEQRIGRIKRFGQIRPSVDMLNLVNQGTVDETVYERLSERMRDRYNLFGALPDTIKDEWIDDIENLGEKMDEYIDAQQQATGFDLRYTQSMRPSDKDWRDCAEVLSREDFGELMTAAWK